MSAHPLTQELVANAHGHLAGVQHLLEQHPELIDARYDAWNETALEAAAHTGSADIARLLLSRGATPNHVAWAMLGHTDELRGLLSAQPELAQTPGAHGISLLYHAALSGQVPTLQAAWDAGARDGLDRALLAATSVRSEAALGWLLERGAALKATTMQGKTALEEAQDAGWAAGVARLQQAAGPLE